MTSTQIYEKFEILLSKYMKSEIAVWCGLEDTRSLDMWVTRKVIPKKYHKIIIRKASKEN
jgi:hypothetical protein